MEGIKYIDENRFAQIKLCVNDAERSHMEVKRYYEKISNKKFDYHILQRIYKGSSVQFKEVDVNAKDLKAFEFWSSEIRNEKLCVEGVDSEFKFDNKIFKYDKAKQTFFVVPEILSELKDSCVIMDQFNANEEKLCKILYTIKDVLVTNKSFLDDLKLSKLEWLDKSTLGVLEALYDSNTMEFKHNIKKGCQQLNVGHKYGLTKRKKPIH